MAAMRPRDLSYSPDQPATAEASSAAQQAVSSARPQAANPPATLTPPAPAPPLQMPNTQRLIRRHHHLSLVHQPVLQYRPPRDPHCRPIRRQMHRLCIRPASPPCPEPLPSALKLLLMEIPPDTGKAHEQLLDPLLMKLLRQCDALRPAQQGVDHHGRLQRRRQRLENPVPGQGSTAIAASPTRSQSSPTQSPARIAVLLRACTCAGASARASNSSATRPKPFVSLRSAQATLPCPAAVRRPGSPASSIGRRPAGPSRPSHRPGFPPPTQARQGPTARG